MIYLFLTMACFIFFNFLQSKLKSIFFNPILMTILFIILILKIFDIPYEVYEVANVPITFLLGPATVSLALPLYRNWDIFKRNSLTLCIGIFVGTVTAVSSVYLFSKLFGIDNEIMLSILPKSITTPIGIEISETIGGIPSLTVALIILTGIIGNTIGPSVIKILKIKDSIAVGAAFGTSSHAIGTSKAIQMGDLEGAISGISISLAGIISSILIPIFVKLV